MSAGYVTHCGGMPDYHGQPKPEGETEMQAYHDGMTAQQKMAFWDAITRAGGEEFSETYQKLYKRAIDKANGNPSQANAIIDEMIRLMRSLNLLTSNQKEPA